MKNTDIILKSKIYNDYLNELEYLERDRFFCRHNYEHFVSVARICYILKLEEGVDVDKDMIYSTALLHDLGRVLEIKEGINHAIASVALEPTGVRTWQKMNFSTSSTGQTNCQGLALGVLPTRNAIGTSIRKITQ